MDRAAPTHTQRATVGLGCFWGPDAQLGALDGVVRTRVGYAGGTTAAPTYDAIGDHIEAVRVEYDPTQIDYPALLEWFWANHNPARPPFKRQYQPALFPHTDAQAEPAHASAAAMANRRDASLATEVIANASFFRAEPYHQKYTLRRHPTLLAAFQAVYPTDRALTDSPAAALLNGYVGGHRAPHHLDADRARLGLPSGAEATLQALVERKHA